MEMGFLNFTDEALYGSKYSEIRRFRHDINVIFTFHDYIYILVQIKKLLFLLTFIR